MIGQISIDLCNEGRIAGLHSFHILCQISLRERVKHNSPLRAPRILGLLYLLFLVLVLTLNQLESAYKLDYLA